MARKLDKTAADYLAIAISPVLIMVLVGSLAFFLLEVLYSGEFESRLRWILFWFVLASVLVARIAIEQGREHAAVYGLALAGATGLVCLRFVDSVVAAWILLAVIWWCAHKLTWDCTLIDEQQDASGKGLLQIASFDDDGATENGSKPQRPWWRRIVAATSDEPGQPHAPGVWVVYFSLAALPLFGVGQLFIADERARKFAFQLLWLYVAAGLGLLLTTSFLGLRRYLRQRRLQMPTAMTGSWIGMGTGLIIAILVISLFLPRPDGSISAWAATIDSLSREASRYALLGGDAGEGEGAAKGKKNEPQPGDGQNAGGNDPQHQGDGGAGQTKGDKRSGTASGKDKSEGKNSGSGGEGQNTGQGQGDQKKGTQAGQSGDPAQKGQNVGQQKNKGDDKNADAEQERKAEGDHQDNQAGGPSQDKAAPLVPHSQDAPQFDPADSVEDLARLIKWIIYGVLITLVVIAVVWNWSLILNGLARFWQAWLDFWARLFAGREQKRQAEEAADAAPPPPPPFASFRNPFSSGMAERASPEQLVRYTFEALQAWALERQQGRRLDQTPLEFARALETQHAEVSREAVSLAQFYARLAYAGRTPSADCLPTLERLWVKLMSA